MSAPRPSIEGQADRPLDEGRALVVAFLALKNLRAALDRPKVVIGLSIPPEADQAVLRLVREEADAALALARPVVLAACAAAHLAHQAERV